MGGMTVIAGTRFAAALGACLLAFGATSAIAAPERSAPSLEDAVLDRINNVRAHPQEYAEQLRDYVRYFQGNIVFMPGDQNGLITNEGPEAVYEAIDFLEHQAPLPPLSGAQILSLAAQDHADEEGSIGGTGHVSPDGANPGERVRRRGGDIYVGETIYYGTGDPDAVIRGFIVDDGVRTRGHRTLIFSDGFRFAGVGCGMHARFETICVVDYSGTADGAPVIAADLKARGASLFVYRGPAGLGGNVVASTAR